MDISSFPNITSLTPPDTSQTMCGMYDDPVYKPYFTDLRPLADEQTVLKNPHKGWFWHYIDNGYARGAYRQGHDPEDDLKDFPGLNHLYLRFDWGDIEKEEGVYDFSYLDSIMETWGKRGYTFSMRACTYEGDAALNHATPAYVYQKGARGFLLEDGKIQPDFSDPVFLYHLERFMEAFGKKYNGDPRLECIDIGTIGTWGEGHTVEGDNRIYPLETVKSHFDLHARYFPDTFIICNDDHMAGRYHNGAGEVQEILEYAASRGFGVQDDSICCDYYTQMNGYDTMRTPWAFDRLWLNAPSVIEMAHYTYIKPQYESYFRGGLTAMEAFKRSHATFAGFHGYPRHWLENEYYLTEYCANRLGYWYFINWAEIPPLSPTAHNIIKIGIENRGWAKAYWKYDLYIRLKGEGGSYEIPVTCDNTLWLPSIPQTLTLKLDLRGVPSGDYQLSLGMFEKEVPIRLAMKTSCFDGKYYDLCNAKVL